MAIKTADPFVLATAVASPAGTVTLAYPTGTNQAFFTGDYASGTAYVLLNDNDRYEEVDDEFDISYGASVITVTNKTTYTWVAGTKVQLGLGYAAAATTYQQVGAIADVGGSLTGTTDGDLADVADIALSTSNTYTDAAVNAAVNTAVAAVNVQLKELQEAHNALLAGLRVSGLIATS